MKIIICCIIFFASVVYGQGGLDYSAMMPYLQDMNNKNETKLEKIQTMFIKELFVDEIFKVDTNITGDDDDGILSSQSMQFYNSMLNYEIAKSLAKQDILGLNDLDIDTLQ
ncbi:hypothetical protein DID76_04455 [Candidatus Marinamargulisbacteria bacterium SCGC AG-414-C22]|nr:hypothetical protein DID76_04455 [Candidatus Marinamargulisbacteria bacterium SCGC AG-414-C22]